MLVSKLCYFCSGLIVNFSWKLIFLLFWGLFSFRVFAGRRYKDISCQKEDQSLLVMLLPDYGPPR